MQTLQKNKLLFLVTVLYYKLRSNITITCSYCDKKVTEGAVRKKLDERDYFFCCTTCQGAFEEKYGKLKARSR